ncbi:MAG: hypothetical protein IPN03_03010 [Holophagales bacterium]|nr:hypothetical protein [Holophagales bacterium]
MKVLRTLLLSTAMLSLPAMAQEHVHGDPGAPGQTPSAERPAANLDVALRDERSALRALRASVRSRERERVDRSVGDYVSVQDELRAGLRAGGEDDGRARDASRVQKVCRESLATLRGLADAAPPALGELVDEAIAAAERTFGTAAELAGEEAASEPRTSRGGCGMGSSGHRGH